MSRSIASPPRLHPVGSGRRVLWAATIALLCAGPAFAQRGGPGGGRGPGGPPDLFENEGFREEVGLSADQIEKLRELREASREGLDREKIGEMFRNATTDEERQKVREQMSEQFRAAEEKFQEQSKEVFTDEQRERYQQIQVRQRGVSGAIESDDLAAELKLTDEQRDAMREIRDAEFAKLRESGDWAKFRDPEFRQQLEEKMLEKVSDEQRNAYQQKIGPAPSYDLFNRGDRRGAGGPQTVTGQEFGALREFDTAVPEGATATIDFGRGRRREMDQTEIEASVETATAMSDVAEAAGADAVVPAAVADAIEEPTAAENTMSFNFRYAPWEPVLREFAQFAGLTLDPGPVPPGTFNYFDDGEYTPTEALDILNGYLLQRGYVLVRRDRFLICANIDEGIPPNLVPDVALEDLPDRGDNELVRVVIPLKGSDSKTAVQEIEPFLGPQGTAASLTAMNSVVVRDIGGNVRRIAALLGQLGQEIVFEQVPLKHLDAYDAAMAVRTQLGMESSNSRDRRGGSSNENQEISVAADERTQTLLITARPEKILLVKEILKAVDVSEDADGNPIAYASSRPVFRSYPLQSADPDDVRDTIVSLFPDAMVNEDDRGRAVHINAAPGQQERIAEIVQQIDGNVRAETQSVVIPLSRLDPLSVTLTLNNMFIAEGEKAPVVEPDPLGRRLLVRATPDQVSEIKGLLLQLGEDGTGARAAGGSLRTISLGGRDPERMVPLLQQMWEIRDPTPIRIVTPSAPNAVERRGAPASRTEKPVPQEEARLDDPFSVLGGPSFSLPQDDPAAPQSGDAAAPASEPAAPAPATPTPAAAESGESLEDALNAAAGNASADVPPADPNAPVTMTVLDGQLVLYSEDEEKLNELEDLVARLGSLIPPDDGWNVFYLVNADATATAETLEQLIPSASVAGVGSDGTMMGTMASGLSSFGGSLMDVAGVSSLGGPTSLKIVPDVRANALYVQGPRTGVRQVEQLLTVLDADSRPDNARERLPRTIPVQYADVNEVAEIVREVFKEQTSEGMAAQMASRSRGGGSSRGGGDSNPLAMLMGGMAGGGDAASVQLSIGVDTRTSRLVVSAPESLFQQVEDLVQDLDLAAKDAERGVQFMTLRDADPTSVTAALSSMMPRVSGGGGSVVRSPRSTGGGGSTPSPRSDDNGGGTDAAARALMFQQMMQNRGGGDGGRGAFGGRGGGDAGGGRGDAGGGRGDAGGGGQTRGGRGGR
ncbi:secretin N-terminal domain-containing protein [Alienimonas californiensis]|uniref:Bacterial type II/III secretion system short domain protein n=1 Tax=Alienimonas californiensis TaxID=2527989 RepID=A0A517PDV7_9PLAN|nr:secretin N-terminal domain-containing protein [Alienimonas californiensis]QDT17562.1 Bacterial type II/III secretion system short domain protein [Alienimonas californiensis]